MGKRKKGKTVKNNLQNKEEPDHLKYAPHSFVIHRGLVGKYVKYLTRDFRKIMEPFTASSLVVRRKNTIKDFVSVAGPLHVSHMVIFTHSSLSAYMRIVKLPQGPTLTFKIHNYSLGRDVRNSLRKQISTNKCFLHSPLVIMNGFSADSNPHVNLLTTTFQGMFPVININKVRLNDMKRCLLLNYNQETKLIELRHYGILVAPVGISRGVKKMMKGKIPNLAKYNDVSEYLLRGDVSESEGEDEPASHVTLPQKISSRGNMVDNQSAVRVSEIGPRLTLQLVKVEDGLMGGDVLFHEYVKKTKEELEKMKRNRVEKRRLRDQRRREQEANVRKKEAAKKSLKEKCVKPKLKRDEERVKEEDDDDAEWYRQEVGEEPDPEIFKKTESTGFKRKALLRYMPNKKPKLQDGQRKRFPEGRDKFEGQHKSQGKEKWNKSRESPKGNKSSGSKRGSGPERSGFKRGSGPEGSGFKRGSGPKGSGFKRGSGPKGSGFKRGSGPKGSGFKRGSGPQGSGFKRKAGTRVSGGKRY